MKSSANSIQPTNLNSHLPERSTHYASCHQARPPEVTHRERCTSGLQGRALIPGPASLTCCLCCSGGFTRGKELRWRHWLGCAGLGAASGRLEPDSCGRREDRCWGTVRSPSSALGSRPRVPTGRPAGDGRGEPQPPVGAFVQPSRVTFLTPEPPIRLSGGGSALLVTVIQDLCAVKWRAASLTGPRRHAADCWRQDVAHRLP